MRLPVLVKAETLDAVGGFQAWTTPLEALFELRRQALALKSALEEFF